VSVQEQHKINLRGLFLSTCPYLHMYTVYNSQWMHCICICPFMSQYCTASVKLAVHRTSTINIIYIRTCTCLASLCLWTRFSFWVLIPKDPQMYSTVRKLWITAKPWFRNVSRGTKKIILIHNWHIACIGWCISFVFKLLEMIPPKG
jgi:hypothetical protein